MQTHQAIINNSQVKQNNPSGGRDWTLDSQGFWLLAQGNESALFPARSDLCTCSIAVRGDNSMWATGKCKVATIIAGQRAEASIPRKSQSAGQSAGVGRTIFHLKFLIFHFSKNTPV
jgi:hypothetical protein